MAATFQRAPRIIPPGIPVSTSATQYSFTTFSGLQRATRIQLSNVPPTATPADLRRLIARGQVQGVEDGSKSLRGRNRCLMPY